MLTNYIQEFGSLVLIMWKGSITTKPPFITPLDKLEGNFFQFHGYIKTIIQIYDNISTCGFRHNSINN